MDRRAERGIARAQNGARRAEASRYCPAGILAGACRRRYHNRRAGKVFPGTDPASLQDEGLRPVALLPHWPLARRHSLVSRSIIHRSHEPYAHFRSTLSSWRQELSDERWAGAARSSQMASRAGAMKSTPSRTPPMSASQSSFIRTPLLMAPGADSIRVIG